MAARAKNGATKRYLMRNPPSCRRSRFLIGSSADGNAPPAGHGLGSLLLLLRLGPLAGVFRHLNFNCRVAWLDRERVHVDGLFSHAAPAAAAKPVAIGDKHEL